MARPTTRNAEPRTGLDATFGAYSVKEQPARSAVLSRLLVDVRVEDEVVAYRALR